MIGAQVGVPGKLMAEGRLLPQGLDRRRPGDEPVPRLTSVSDSRPYWLQRSWVPVGGRGDTHGWNASSSGKVDPSPDWRTRGPAGYSRKLGNVPSAPLPTDFQSTFSASRSPDHKPRSHATAQEWIHPLGPSILRPSTAHGRQLSGIERQAAMTYNRSFYH